jgi:DNA invertase Pin-like site-specific DNA recombinase
MNEFDTEQFVKLQASKLTARQIADRMGCDPRTVQRWRSRLGLAEPARPFAGKPIPAERMAQVRSMFDDGASKAEVVRTMHVSRQTLARYFPDDGWTPTEGGEYAAMVRQLNRLAAFQTPKTARRAA